MKATKDWNVVINVEYESTTTTARLKFAMHQLVYINMYECTYLKKIKLYSFYSLLSFAITCNITYIFIHEYTIYVSQSNNQTSTFETQKANTELIMGIITCTIINSEKYT